jgi:pSer/pThr/pTyr-binding forkhead associated (FHA) protein
MTAASSTRIRLRYLSGPRAGEVEVYATGRYKSLSIGRDPSCDVRLHPVDDVVVSRNHALIEWSDDEPPLFRVSDLLSSNGTFLNGRRIGRSVLLRSGDQLQLGTSGPLLEVGFERDVVGAAEGSVPAVREPSRTQEMPIPTIRHKIVER